MKIQNKYLNENIKTIPVDASLNNNPTIIKDNKYNCEWKYFGNCINTVDKDKMWDATQMSNVLQDSVVYLGKKKLVDGDRKLPKEALSDNVIVGVNEYQEIGFVYNIDNDMHYFFDIWETLSEELKQFNFPHTPSLDRELKYLLNNGYKLQIVDLKKLAEDNDLYDDSDLQYHTQIWGKDPSQYRFDNSQINKWFGSDIISGVKKKSGRIELENGRHRCRALLNSGYTSIEMPVKEQEPLDEDLKDDAKNYFGTTWNWKLAIYINTDGTLLDGSGEKLGNHRPSGRAIDHREISDIFNDAISGSDAMTAYMNEGNIRWKPEAPGFELIKEPTKEQYTTLEQLISYFKDTYYVDISNKFGDVIWSKSYEPFDSHSTIIDIKKFFANSNKLTEDTRNQLIAKSRNADEYKDKKYGKNRFERKKYSKIATQVKSYNEINMDDFFKRDILLVNIPVTGETKNYTVLLEFSGVVAEIAKNIKSNNNKLEFKTILQALTKVFNTGNVKVKCTCPDFQFSYSHNLILNQNSVDGTDKDPGAGKTGRVAQMKGQGCKHILLCLNNIDWIMKVASVLKNYIFYAEEHMQKAFLKVIFPKLYGIPASAAEEENLVPEDINLDTEKHIIEVINEWAKGRGKIQKGSNKNPAAGKGTMQGPKEENKIDKKDLKKSEAEEKDKK